MQNNFCQAELFQVYSLIMHLELSLKWLLTAFYDWYLLLWFLLISCDGLKESHEKFCLFLDQVAAQVFLAWMLTPETLKWTFTVLCQQTQIYHRDQNNWFLPLTPQRGRDSHGFVIYVVAASTVGQKIIVAQMLSWSKQKPVLKFLMMT